VPGEESAGQLLIEQVPFGLQFSQLGGARFQSEKDKTAALELASKMVSDRLLVGGTQWMSIHNKSTLYDVKIALASGEDEGPDPEPPPGFVRYAPLMMIGIEVPPGQTEKGYLGVNCYVTRARGGCKWRHRPTGREGDLYFDDLVVANPEEDYWITCGWEILDPVSPIRKKGSEPAPPRIGLFSANEESRRRKS
jgi:hypothetical protein